MLIPKSMREGFCAVFLCSSMVGAAENVRTANDSTLTIGGSGTDLGTMRLIVAAFQARNPQIEVDVLPSLGSGGGVRALAAHALDIAITSRPLKESERQPGIQSTRYADTPLVIAVSTQTPVEEITSQTFKDILVGKRSRWPDGTATRPILRPRQDSDVLVLESGLENIASAFEIARTRRGLPVATSDQDSADKLETIPGAIGTSTLALILAEGRKLKPLTLDEVAPTVENLRHGRYSLTKSLYVVTAVRPSEAVRDFVTFLASEQSNVILEVTGHVPAN